MLEKRSETLEQHYRSLGIAFVRNVGAGVLILTVGTGAMLSAGIFTAGAATIATATLVALPAYYIGVISVNHSNKSTVSNQFTRRRLKLPLTLGPGEVRTGSLFYPMIPNPRALDARWSDGLVEGPLTVSLEPLQGLHIEAPRH